MATAPQLLVDADVSVRMDDNIAAGAGPHLPIGNWDGAEYRAAIRFPKPAWGAWTSITKATLTVYISDHAHVGPKNSSIYVRRNQIGDWWTKGAGTQDCNVTFSSSNNTQSADLNAATTDQVSFSSGSTANAKKTIDVTELVRTYWAYDQKPVFIFDNVGSDDYTELWSEEKTGGYNAALDITYEDAVAPTAPTLNSPVGGVMVDDDSPRVSWTHNHPQGNAQTEAHVRVFDAAGAQIGPTYTVTGATNYMDVPTLARGASYRWDVQTRNAAVGYGPYAAYQTFSVRPVPVVSISVTREMVWDGAPRLVVRWTSDQPQAGFQVYGPSGYDSGYQGGGAQVFTLSGLALTNGASHTITVNVLSAYGGVGSDSQAFTPRWGLSTHSHNLGAVPLGWGTPSVLSTIPSGAYMPIEYGSSDTDIAAPTGGWTTTLAAVPYRQWLHYRVWFIPSASAGPVLDRLIVPVNNTVKALDKWGTTKNVASLGAPFRIDDGEFVYGSRSIAADVPGAGPYICYSFDIEVRKGRSYILTGLMKSVGNSGALIRLADESGATLVNDAGDFISTVGIPEDREWYQSEVLDTRRYKTPVWECKADQTVNVVLRCGGTAGAKAWWDAIKLEESTVATPWSPGAVGAVVVDAGGVQVDAQRGGVFRLRGSAGQPRDEVALGTNGLVFGGDTPVFSPSARALQVGSDSGSGGSFVAIGAGSTGSEGGELNLKGVGSLDDWNIDNYAGELRVHGAGAARLTVRKTSPHVAVTGDLGVSGAISGALDGADLGAASVPNSKLANHGLHVQGGMVTVTFSASPDSSIHTVTFSPAFTAAPAVSLTCDDNLSRGTAPKVPVAGLPTASSFQLYARQTAGTALTGTVRVWWVAVGPMA